MIIHPKLRYSGIYCIINIYNGRTYVGSAINIYIRWHVHVQELKANKHGNVYLQDAYNKHGLIGLVFSVIERVNNKYELVEREQFYMERFKSIVPNGYNILPKAGSRLGTKASDETKAKLSKARRTRITKEETRIKLSIAHTNRIMTPEHKFNLSKAAKLIVKTPEHLANIKLAQKRRRERERVNQNFPNSTPMKY